MRPAMSYDPGCPVCSNFMLLVRQKAGAGMDYIEAADTDGEFTYTDSTGRKHVGAKAIDRLAADFPAIKDYMFMLPPKYKVAGLKMAYKVGSAIRKTYNTITRRGCNCGSKK